MAIVSFVIGRKTKKTLTPKQIEELYFTKTTEDELDEMRKESKEALAERTESRKEKILDFMKNEAVHQEELKTCNLDDSKTDVTSADIEKLLEVSNVTARKYLNELESEGKIKQIGEAGRSVYYTLNT